MIGRNGYLDRMTERLGQLESELAALSTRPAGEANHDEALRDARAGIAAARERLQTLRRAGAELTDEMAQSFTQSFERLQGEVGRVRGATGGRPHAA